MKYTLAILSLAASASAAAIFPRGNSCACSGFTLTATGGFVVGQLSDGQNRIKGGPLPTAKYNLCDGMITDASGRGCILTPPTTQFQCDKGAKPDSGFGIDSAGYLTHNGNEQFYACATGDHGEYNIYTQKDVNPGACIGIKLQTSCKVAPEQKVCPTTLGAGFEFPHLIIPVDSSHPNTAYGTQYFGKVTPTVSSIFNFDIPSSDQGKTCSLVFLFPTQSQLTTSSFTFSGNGAIDFSLLDAPATGATDYANRPGVKTNYGVTTVAPGHSYRIATFPCPAGTAIGFELSGTDTNLNYFQDYNPSPIGLYITTC